ncbi:MAG TPA: hypothetical protein IGS31_21270 [Oscillatoriales cyanobacterium M4454_W2019_049]|nr:hypothetical protein [Oscillatoriales cyanobacterium M4454_W2019_049]
MPQMEVRVNYYRLVLTWILVIACTIGVSLLTPESNDRSNDTPSAIQ